MTETNAHSSPKTAFFEPSPFKLVLLTSIVMLLCIIASSAFIYVLSQNQAKLYTDNQVSMVKTQAQITLQPMILAKDTLSMNIYLRTVAQVDFINGITLTNTKNKLLARAGENFGDLEKKAIFSQRLEIGEISFYINKTPAITFFNKLLWVFVALTALTALFTLIAVAFLSKRILQDFTNQYKPLLEHRFSMALEEATENNPQSEPQALANVITKHETPTTLAIVDLDIGHKKQQVNSGSQNSTAQDTPPDSQQNPDTVNKPATIQNNALVSLLKPDAQQRMPHFKPFSQQDTKLVANKPSVNSSTIELTESIELIEEDLSTTPKPSKNPLMRKHSQEKQLDLYSLEHQGELNLKAENAAYILFIDCSSGRAPIEDPVEHKELLSQYRRLIKLVIKIYGGAVELLASGDIRVMFDDRTTDDSHGIKALCAAKLFNQLYKFYNHRQITRMLPTLNIKISLVRGSRDKIEILREECQFLTRTTVSNELISHTPLSEIPALKDSLLDEAVTERQEEDKILILELNQSYQELLEKQARHLVKGL